MGTLTRLRRAATCSSSTRSIACRASSRSTSTRRWRTSRSTSSSTRVRTPTPIALPGRAVHAGRRHHAQGPAVLAIARAVRAELRAGFLRGRRPDLDRASLGRSAERRARRRRRRRDCASLARDAAHRQSTAAPRARLRPGASRRRTSGVTWSTRRSRSKAWTTSGMDDLDRRYLKTLIGHYEGRRRASQRSPRRCSRRSTRSRTSSNRICCTRDSCCARPAGRQATPKAYAHLRACSQPRRRGGAATAPGSR